MEGYDRCTVRKEIDNDDPFPISDSIKRKNKKREPTTPLSRLQKSHTEPPSSLLMLDDENTPREVKSSNRFEFVEVKTPGETDKENLNHCLNELYHKKEQVVKEGFSS